MKFYLSSRHQSVYINCTKSDTKERTCGIPQGPILGLDLFAIYSLPLADLIRKHHVLFHFFADDGKLYIIFDPVAPNRVKLTKD